MFHVGDGCGVHTARPSQISVGRVTVYRNGFLRSHTPKNFFSSAAPFVLRQGSVRYAKQCKNNGDFGNSSS
jgi:hypothetical protein